MVQRMKYVAITFDDGRSDNYDFAKPIMDAHGLRGTVYITTGFIDGTWPEKDVLQSPTKPLQIEQILQLHRAGWEIGLHGDQHQMQVEDTRTAMEKLQAWGIENTHWGISMPNSRAEQTQLQQILCCDYAERIAYIRRGRMCDTSKLSNKVFFALYTYAQSSWAYRRFNLPNVFRLQNADKAFIPSVVVKAKDRPEMILDFINRLPEGAAVVLMLHSILPAGHPLCGKDPWSWEDKRFEVLCKGLQERTEQGIYQVLPLAELLKG